MSELCNRIGVQKYFCVTANRRLLFAHTGVFKKNESDELHWSILLNKLALLIWSEYQLQTKPENSQVWQIWWDVNCKHYPNRNTDKICISNFLKSSFHSPFIYEIIDCDSLGGGLSGKNEMEAIATCLKNV